MEGVVWLQNQMCPTSTNLVGGCSIKKKIKRGV